MKNKNKLLVLLMILVIAFCAFSLVACNTLEDDVPDSSDYDDVEETVSDTALIKNGRFASTSDTETTYLKKTLTSWSVNDGKTDTDNANHGIIDLTEEQFNANFAESVYGGEFAYPGIAPNTKADSDTNALVLVSEKDSDGNYTAGSYYAKTSSTISLSANKYYKLSVDVCTKITDGDEFKGAYILVDGNAYAEFQAIDTNGTWETYTVYIESNNKSAKTINVQLWLGYGRDAYKFGNIASNTNSKVTDNLRLTNGVALFDNITLEEVSAEEGKGTENTVVSDTKNVKKTYISLIYPDIDMTYTASANSYAYNDTARTGTINSSMYTTQSNYTSLSNSFSTSSSGIISGIFDMSKLFTATVKEGGGYDYVGFENINKNFVSPDSNDFMTNDAYDLKDRPQQARSNKALTIFYTDSQDTSYGYKSANTFVLKKNTYYTISVWAYIWSYDYDGSVSKPTNEESATYADDLQKYNDAVDAYNKKIETTKAYFKLSGTTIEGDAFVEETDPTKNGTWQQLTFNILGNELADKEVSLEFWFGDGVNNTSVGGVMFNDLTITANTEPLTEVEYLQVSKIQDEDYQLFGLTEDTLSDNWTIDFEDDNTDKSFANVSIITDCVKEDNLKDDEELPFAIGKTKLNIIKYQNKDYTASTLSFKPAEALKFVKNSFYRVAMWIKTVDVDGTALSLSLINYTDDSSISKISSIDSDGDWKEISFYVKGDSFEDIEYYLQFVLGTGNVYSPDTHTQGSVYITAITASKISYTEFNAGTSTTGVSAKYEGQSDLDKLASDKEGTYNTTANGLFDEYDTSSIKDDSIFDDEGNLVGIVPAEGWTGSEKTSLTSVTISYTTDNTKLQWKDSNYKYVDAYQIFMDEVVIDGKKYNNVFIDEVKKPDAYDGSKYIEWQINVNNKGKFKVRAIRNVKGEDEFVAVSSFSSTKSYEGNIILEKTLTLNDVMDTYNKYVKAGIIDYTNYNGGEFNSFAQTFEESGATYFSAKNNNIAIITSDSDSVYTLTSDSLQVAGSSTFSENSYYMVSVWVKTIGDAKASITIDNSSNPYTQNDNYVVADCNEFIGYVNQNTGDKWVQYRLYIKTNAMTSVSGLKLELSLGNPYAKVKTIDTKSYIMGQSSGTVLFSTVQTVKLEEEQYNKFVGVTEDNLVSMFDTDGNIEYNLYGNDYIYRIVNFATNGFDSYEEGKEPIGGSTSVYTQGTVTDGTKYDTSSTYNNTNITPMLYGIYTQDSAYEAIKPFVEGTYTNGTDGEETNTDFKALFGSDVTNLEKFLGKGDAKDNSLFLVNIIPNGQYYKSSAVSLKKDVYYKVTFKASLKAPEGKNAQFHFTYNSSADKEDDIIDISGAEEKTYTFYVYNSQESDLSSNYYYFYLGNSEADEDEGEQVDDFFVGILMIDDVTFEQVEKETFENANKLSAEEKLAANTVVSTVEVVESDDTDDGDTDDATDDTDTDEDKTSSVWNNSQLWLMISSIVIGAILIAVVVVLCVKAIKKRIKKNVPVKVISNVPVNMETKEEKKAKKENNDNKKDTIQDFKD